LYNSSAKTVWAMSFSRLDEKPFEVLRADSTAEYTNQPVNGIGVFQKHKR